MIAKDEFLQALARLRTDQIVVTCMSLVRPWARYSNSLLDFASADSAMGHAADLALGIAMAQPQRRVICLNGDGSMLMSLGTLVTIIESGVTNLVLFVAVNRTYEITGNQPIPAAERVDFAAMARAAGFERVFEFDHPDDYQRGLDDILSGTGPTFVCVHGEPGSEGPIGRKPQEQARYLQVSLADWSRNMRAVLRGQK